MVNQSLIKNGKRKALIIGISKYDHNNKFRDLDFCENDANEVYRILKDQDYEIAENAKLVGRVEWSKMHDEIVDFFTDNTLRPEDTLFFYFSGHGYLDKNTSHTYLATSEIDPASPKRRGIPFKDLTDNINDSNSERIVAVLDCCYSGALEVIGGGKGEEEEESAAKAVKGEEMADSANANMQRTVDRLIKSGQGKCILASSLEEQKSFKMQDQPYSTFTYYLIQGLRGAEGESVDGSGYVTPELLGGYVNKKMYELPAIKQKPVRKIEGTGLLILAHYPNLVKARQQQQQQPQTFERDYLLQLLKEGKTKQFNTIHGDDNNYSIREFYFADLSGCKLSYVNLKAANLSGAKLVGADLSNADLSRGMLLNADLSNANLSEANLLGVDLSNANLTGADLSSANLSGARLLGADVSNVRFSSTRGGPPTNLSKANLSGVDLSSGAHFSSTDLSFINLSGANLSKADLSHVYLSHADLSGVDLSNANLSYANLEKANLSHADFSKADLSHADLSGVDLSNANLNNSNLASSKIIGLKFIDNEKDYPYCKDANFDNLTIIDDEHLSKYFRSSNSNPESIPPVVKDKKELRGKLEKRGFDKETIYRYLSFSSLPD
jgi:uncharacterized protein YjbI with pentapeptide repeats